MCIKKYLLTLHGAYIIVIKFGLIVLNWLHFIMMWCVSLSHSPIMPHCALCLFRLAHKGKRKHWTLYVVTATVSTQCKVHCFHSKHNPTV